MNAEARIGLIEHMDLSMFVDAGNVGPDAGALNLDQRSYGAGIRFHTRSSTLARLDLAHGKEQGWRFTPKLHVSVPHEPDLQAHRLFHTFREQERTGVAP